MYPCELPGTEVRTKSHTLDPVSLHSAPFLLRVTQGRCIISSLSRFEGVYVHLQRSVNIRADFNERVLLRHVDLHNWDRSGSRTLVPSGDLPISYMLDWCSKTSLKRHVQSSFFLKITP